jgi:hypothetical protein
MRVSSSVPKVIQQLLTSSSSSSCHFYPHHTLKFQWQVDTFHSVHYGQLFNVRPTDAPAVYLFYHLFAPTCFGRLILPSSGCSILNNTTGYTTMHPTKVQLYNALCNSKIMVFFVRKQIKVMLKCPEWPPYGSLKPLLHLKVYNCLFSKVL